MTRDTRISPDLWTCNYKSRGMDRSKQIYMAAPRSHSIQYGRQPHLQLTERSFFSWNREEFAFSSTRRQLKIQLNIARFTKSCIIV